MTYADWRDRLGEANDPELYPLAYQDSVLEHGQYWENEGAAAITIVVTYPSGAKVCKVYAAAGEMAPLMEMKVRWEEWSRQQGCKFTMLDGRDGWRRKHPDYRHHQTVIIKEL